MIQVEILSKPDCHLCEVAKATLQRVRRVMPFELEEIDIRSDRNLLDRYREEIPVIFINGRKAFKYRVDEDKLIEKLRRLS